MLKVMLWTLVVLAALFDEKKYGSIAASHADDSTSLEEYEDDYYNSETSGERSFVAAPAGANESFNCTTNMTSPLTVQWLKNGMSLLQQKEQGELSSNKELDNVQSNLILYFWNLTVSDSGLYTCIVNGSEGTMERNFTLEVIQRDWSPPRIVFITPNQTVAEGVNVTLQCYVESDLTAHIVWVKLGNAEHFTTFNETNVVKRDSWNVSADAFTLQCVTKSDSGQYACVASTDLGSSSESTWLEVISNSSAVSADGATL